MMFFSVVNFSRTERMQPNHEGHVADVLLSLKHAVLKPNSESPQMPTHQQASNYPSDGYSKITPQASVSYIASVHPQMHLLSPSNYNTMTSQAQNPYPSSSYYDNCVQHPPPAMYPSSLSVNVSMTMHGCGGAVDTPILPMQCSHSQVDFFKVICFNSSCIKLSNFLLLDAMEPTKLRFIS
jgi:hypothetical protein